MDQSSCTQQCNAVRGAGGGTTVHPTDNDPNVIIRNRRCKLPRTTTNAHPEEQAMCGERITSLAAKKSKQNVSQKFSGMEVAFSFPLYCGQRSGWSTYHRDSVCAGHDIQQHVHLHGGASADILYEHCFQRLRPEVKSQLNPATTSLTGFTEKRYGPMGQIRLRLWLAIRCTSSTAWMDCYGDQITSPYNGIYWKDRNIAIRAVAPRPGEELIMYLSATHGAISAVLLTDRNSVQTPVYFVSKALKETEINYSAMEKLILALVFAAKRLRRYFQAHPVAVITDQPIKQVISKPDASGRLQKWSVLLGEHNISYRPRTAVKGQILADFLIEKPETDIVLPQSEVKLPEPWILFTDGSSCVDGSGAGLILTNPEGMEFTYALRFEFTATNNEAEYEALLAGLRIAARMGVRNLEANVDSRLVANHVLGEYVAKEDNMVQYLDKTKSLIQGFDRFTIRQVPRGDNKKADALSKIASTSFAHLSKQVLVEILKNKSISEMEISTVIEEQDPTWMTPIVETKAVIQLPSPRTMKEVQSLNGKLAGLNRFLSKSADKSLPLFKTLKKCAKKGDFRWTTEAEEAFTQLKQHIAALPTLVAPRPGEELIMYLSATHGAISAVLLTDRDSVQTPVYFVSKALKETEINYSAMEKLILALVFAAKRLRRYFQAHPIVVITDQPIKQVISKPDASGRLQKWSVLLGEHNISYRLRTAVKGQILADFLIEKP
ncbi:reverse transcriptase domain-containing protein [Tanacetum coccineum]|uniref:Reverse transcriptase domain-containing protein n=1 Tax=Tanacetum coccineum TaxID=301880 RepID=A0ABQ4WQ17_9ASTR